MTSQKVFAWLIPNSPDFYFLPALHYHKAYGEWDDGTWDCPAYLASVGFPIIPCYKTEDESEAECWITIDKYGKWYKKEGVHLKRFNRYSLWLEALRASQGVKETTYMLTFKYESPIGRGPIQGPAPTFKSKVHSSNF